jgi:hypothetical protein
MALARELSEIDSQIAVCDSAVAKLRLKSRYAEIGDLIEGTLDAASLEQARTLDGVRFQIWITAGVLVELADLAKSAKPTPQYADAVDRAARRGKRLLHSALKVIDESVRGDNTETVKAMPLTTAPVMRGMIRAAPARPRASHRRPGQMRLTLAGGTAVNK